MKYSILSKLQVIGLAICIAAHVIPAQAESAPFVSGYDRFSRSSQLSAAIAGRLLLTELGCTACHKSTDKTLDLKRGPRLNAAGLRLQADWVTRFLASPASVKPGTTMPDVLHALNKSAKNETIAALVAFLATQDEPFSKLVSTASNPIAIEFWNKGIQDRGKSLYHQVGCVACHEPDKDYAGSKLQTQLEKTLAQLEPDEIKQLGLEASLIPVRSIPHAKLDQKYMRQSLARFLIQPESVRPHGRMPSLKLSPAESADIVAYLLGNQGRAVSLAVTHQTASKELLAAKGARLFEKFGCVQCHDTKQKLASNQIKSLVNLNPKSKASCVSNANAKQPRFVLNKGQLNSIQVAISQLKDTSKSELQPKTQQLASDNAEFKMLQLNCFACHERNMKGGVGIGRRRFFETEGHIDLGDEGCIPPGLDNVGYKLKTTWLKTVLDGKGDLRPYLLARMPRYATTLTQSLPSFLVAADRTSAKPTPQFQNAAKLARAGRELLDTGCVQCHAVRGEKLPGVIGTDVAGIGARINADWFREFLLNPASLKKRTRMPTFFPNGRSGNRTVLNGNVDQQIAALWGYVNDPGKLPLPEKIIAGKIHNFEIKPRDRPVVLRTFMKNAGPHAIAIGFPQGVHVAFDAENVVLAQAWRGRFLDAHGTWFDRFTPLAKPLGKDVVNFTTSPLFGTLTAEDSPWPVDGSETPYRFRGYRLDKAGIPTILYQYKTLLISDRFEPVAGKHLQRTITLTRQSSPESKLAIPIWMLAHSGKLAAAGKDGQTDSHGLTVRLLTKQPVGAIVRESKNRTEWIVPFAVTDKTTVKLRYEWPKK